MTIVRKENNLKIYSKNLFKMYDFFIFKIFPLNSSIWQLTTETLKSKATNKGVLLLYLNLALPSFQNNEK
jgi:hypothetical protein